MRALLQSTVFAMLIMPIVACTSQKIESRPSVNKPGCPAAALTDDDESLDDEALPPCAAEVVAETEGEGEAESGTPEATPADPADFLLGVKPLNDEDAMAFLTDNCDSCHNTKSGSVRSFWPYDKEAFTKEKLTADAATPRVFFSMVMRAKNIIGGKPAAMPPKKMDGKKQEKLLRMVKWMVVEMPAVVTEAKIQFGKGSADDSLGVGVILDFKCKEPASFREYIRRVTNDAFGREPTQDELGLNAKTPEDKASAVDRKKIAARLFEDKAWKQEFETKGLKKFAAKLSGSGDINAQEGQLTEAQATDLKEEFYQILKRDYADKSFKEILLTDNVPVTAETALLYGCEPPSGTAKTWKDCQMTAPRGSYFTSFSYLRSKPTSFLRENNNYGRAALMHFIVRGDVFKAAFDQDGGEEEIAPLPACLKTKDFRGKNTGTAFAWQGAGAIPLTANLCQSCHIDRQMAAGSIVFRPYNTAGYLFGTEHPIDADPDFANATKADMVNRPGLQGADQVVDRAFLESLLVTGADEVGCVPADDEDQEVPLKTVKDLANYVIGDGAVLAGGLARHMPRALSNLQNTSEEIVIKVNDAFTAGKGKLAPAFEAYFASETYGCKR